MVLSCVLFSNEQHIGETFLPKKEKDIWRITNNKESLLVTHHFSLSSLWLPIVLPFYYSFSLSYRRDIFLLGYGSFQGQSGIPNSIDQDLAHLMRIKLLKITAFHGLAEGRISLQIELSLSIDQSQVKSINHNKNPLVPT